MKAEDNFDASSEASAMASLLLFELKASPVVNQVTAQAQNNKVHRLSLEVSQANSKTKSMASPITDWPQVEDHLSTDL